MFRYIKVLPGSVFAAADRLDGMINLFIWRIIK
jgi:hypothetical protein